MAEIVNLRAARKAKARAAGTATAEANRAKHGRTLAERRLAEAEVARLDRALDGARREGQEAAATSLGNSTSSAPTLRHSREGGNPSPALSDDATSGDGSPPSRG